MPTKKRKVERRVGFIIVFPLLFPYGNACDVATLGLQPESKQTSGSNDGQNDRKCQSKRFGTLSGCKPHHGDSNGSCSDHDNGKSPGTSWTRRCNSYRLPDRSGEDVCRE